MLMKSENSSVTNLHMRQHACTHCTLFTIFIQKLIDYAVHKKFSNVSEQNGKYFSKCLVLQRE